MNNDTNKLNLLKNSENIKEYEKEMKIDYSYPKLSDINFQNKIYNKREFYYHKIPYRNILTDYKDIKKLRDEKCGMNFELRTQQYLLSNFINPNTPFKGLLIYHGVGTGKTCTAITIAENFKEQVTKYGTKIYILVSGPLIRENWKDELIKCTGETYLKELNNKSGYINEIDNNRLIKQAKLLTTQYYKIISYKSLYKKVLGQKILEQKIGETRMKKHYKKTIEGEYERDVSINKIETLDNTLLIVDEAHNLTNNEYGNTLIKIISKSKNLKILLLTATPMINFADEIIEVINYLRPQNDPIIRDLVFTNEKSHDMKFKEGGKEYLIKMANGYISHYRGMDPLTFAEIEEMGEIPEQMYFTKLCRCIMLDFQLETYLNVINTKDDSLDRKSQAVSNFCFPGLSIDKKSIVGYHGKEGLNIVKTQIKVNKNFLQKMINKKFFNNTYDNNNIIKDIDKTISGTILKKENLKYFSIKYFNLLNNLDNLVEDKSGLGTAFVYFNLVKVGIELFSEILLNNGYLEYNNDKNYNINNNTIDALTGLTYEEYINKNLPVNNFYPATFISITGKEEESLESSLEAKKKILDSVFNNINNKDGRNIKFVLGSKVMAEGMTLENVKEVHIVDVYYNLSKVHQVIGRAVRQCKHYKIISEKNKFPKVKIYKYVVSLPNQNELTTEEQMYQKAELKYMLIKDTERLLKEVAFDCPINYNGNVFPEEIQKFNNCISAKDLKNKNYTNEKRLICPAQCDLQNCLFKCFNNKLNLEYYDSTHNFYKKITKDKLDFSTFTYSLAKNEINSIKEKLRELYKLRYVYTLDECIKNIKKSYYKDKNDLFEDFFVYKALDELIPITENDFNNFSDTIYDKFNVPGYLIYRNKFYIFQPFDQNEDIPMYYRTRFHSTLFNSLSIYSYLSSLDILSIINNTKQNTFQPTSYNFKDVIEYYENKKEYKYVGIIDKSSLKKRIFEQNIPDIFKLRTSRDKFIFKKRGVGIPSITGAVCDTARKKKELIDIATTLQIDIESDYTYDSRIGLCNLIKYRLLFLEKYSTDTDNNKFTYFIIPINHPIYPFPLNLEDRIKYILNQLEYKIPFQFNHNITKTNNGIFENIRETNLIRYILTIKNNKDIMKYDKILKLLKFDYDSSNDIWNTIIE